MQNEQRPVVVIGAGLAGLTAAATAARNGAPVVLLDTRSPGGRARTDVRGGFRFNQGPHALYRGGPGSQVLDRLGVQRKGHLPPLRGSRGLYEGRLAPLPLGGPVGKRSAAQVARVVTRVARTNPSRWAGHSTREWIDELGLRREASAFTEALVRVTSYVADMDHMPADLAIAQMRGGLMHGVTYLDTGWSQLVDGLERACETAGGQIRSNVAVRAVEGEPGRWRVVASSGEEVAASAVIVAPGSPAAARRLLPVEPPWGALGPEVTAACLDLGLRRTGVRFVLGVDEPLYLSPHCPPGGLAPAGKGMVHVMRYGARAAADDRAQLHGLAEAAGIREGDVEVERFLARMVVVSALPPPERGLAGRPPVVLDGAPGLFLAGDWVGPTGWLADGALASGEKAGLLAAGLATTRVLAPGGKAA